MGLHRACGACMTAVVSAGHNQQACDDTALPLRAYAAYVHARIQPETNWLHCSQRV